MGNKIYNKQVQTVDEITLHSSVSSAGGTTISSGKDIRKYQYKTLLFKATGITSGVGTFTVEVSPNGTASTADWHVYDRIIDSSGNDTPVNKIVLSANGQKTAIIPDYIPYIRTKLSSVTDGSYSDVIVLSS